MFEVTWTIQDEFRRAILDALEPLQGIRVEETANPLQYVPPDAPDRIIRVISRKLNLRVAEVLIRPEFLFPRTYLPYMFGEIESEIDKGEYRHNASYRDLMDALIEERYRPEAQAAFEQIQKEVSRAIEKAIDSARRRIVQEQGKQGTPKPTPLSDATGKIEFIFRGTPYELAQFAFNFGERELEDNPLMWQNSTNGNPYATHPRLIHADTNPIEIALVIDNPNPLFEGKLNAQLFRASDAKIRTLVTGRIEADGDEIDQMIAARYQRLYDELNRLGLIEIPTPNGEARDEITAPAPTEQPKSPRIPKGKRLQVWKTTWSEIQGTWRQEPSETKISLWLQHKRKHLACSPETLRDIIAAGDAGLLD